MKKLITICLLLATTFTVTAQDGKPTKEQTIEYLNSVLVGQEGGRYLNAPSGKSGLFYRMSKIIIDGCILKYNFKSMDITRNIITFDKNIDQEIDFSKVESLKFSTEKTKGEWINYNENLYLYYDVKKDKGIDMFGFYCNPENTEKVLKALNHLRKLCGAPEPINFDGK